MKEKELLRRLGSLPDEIKPRTDVWARIDRAIDTEATGATDDANADVIDSAPAPARVYALRGLALAASIVLVVSLANLLVGRSSPLEAWTVRLVDGTAIASNQLRKGESLSTDSTTRFVATTDIGEVLVERNTSITLEELRSDRQVLTLERGEIYARIVAPPRVFVVQTPSVTAIDLGCEYRLAVDVAGDGILEVVSGWVALEFNDREWFVPAGASSVIDGRNGPAAPVFDDASDRF